MLIMLLMLIMFASSLQYKHIKNMKQKETLTPEEREMLIGNSEAKLEIAKDLDVSINTVYTWALYHTHRVKSKPAAMRIVDKYMAIEKQKQLEKQSA